MRTFIASFLILFSGSYLSILNGGREIIVPTSEFGLAQIVVAFIGLIAGFILCILQDFKELNK